MPNLAIRTIKEAREKIRDFQRKIYFKAKQEKEYRFYMLYDKVFRIDFLAEAYTRVKKNKGAAGVDGVKFEDIEKEGWTGVLKFLNEIQKELVEKIYSPMPVLRIYIPKADGKTRPLGIPTIKDRVVQMSCKIVIEPIFEADFEDSSYGFRPNRGTRDAVKQVKENLQTGKATVLDADLKNFFDTIPHNKILKCIGKRIADVYIIHLIKMWLKAPIVEDGKIKGGKKNRVGTPQGSVISPLTANIYLHYFDKIINRIGGTFQRAGITIIRYADDFILMGRKFGEEVMKRTSEILKHFELELNLEKSRIINAMDEAFDFLGFTFRFDKDLFWRARKYINIFPSEKSSKKFRENIKSILSPYSKYSPEKLVEKLNWIIRGWGNYFKMEGTYPAKEFRRNWWYLTQRLYNYYKRKSQRKSKLYKRSKVIEVLQDRYGLLNFKKILAGEPVKA